MFFIKAQTFSKNLISIIIKKKKIHRALCNEKTAHLIGSVVISSEGFLACPERP